MSWKATFVTSYFGKMERRLSIKERMSTIFMDLSKAFDCINHVLLLAKLKAYGFSENTLKLMCSYSKDRRQAVKMNYNFCSYKKVQAVVPQGSIDDPLLFNLFINDLVLFLSETFLSNYADDNNLYSIGRELNIIKEKLRKNFKVVTDWFSENYMSLNPTKCDYIYLGKNKENDTFSLEIYFFKIVKK